MNPYIKKCFHHHDPITSVLKNLTIISGSSKTCGYITAGCYSNVAIVLLQWMPSYYYHLKCPAVSKVTDSGSLKAFQVEVYLACIDLLPPQITELDILRPAGFQIDSFPIFTYKRNILSSASNQLCKSPNILRHHGVHGLLLISTQNIASFVFMAL